MATVLMLDDKPFNEIWLPHGSLSDTTRAVPQPTTTDPMDLTAWFDRALGEDDPNPDLAIDIPRPDVLLLTKDGARIPAHRTVLLERSCFLAGALRWSTDAAQAALPELSVPGTARVLICVLHAIYSGKPAAAVAKSEQLSEQDNSSVEEATSALLELFDFADMLLLPSLKACVGKAALSKARAHARVARNGPQPSMVFVSRLLGSLETLQLEAEEMDDLRVSALIFALVDLSSQAGLTSQQARAAEASQRHWPGPADHEAEGEVATCAMPTEVCNQAEGLVERLLGEEAGEGAGVGHSVREVVAMLRETAEQSRERLREAQSQRNNEMAQWCLEAQASAAFVPSYEWQEVNGRAVPPGLEVNMALDGSGGCRARIPPEWTLRIVPQGIPGTSTLAVCVTRHTRLSDVKFALKQANPNIECVHILANHTLLTHQDSCTVEEASLFGRRVSWQEGLGGKTEAFGNASARADGAEVGEACDATGLAMRIGQLACWQRNLSEQAHHVGRLEQYAVLLEDLSHGCIAK
ncbi:hypothetical protein CYMTET_50737 [Cymbomonas tetramitiformis]|uniref:BTB domain-containing protein n=1 Tax=Cymbomonas tetramitiformis TaxID=36881 RepID=A0AAE0BP62_9CHLO|nr:hypothetical protein CYMTET_50737 [Cymbomonas tetramitiformis]